jgi:hypothetical protein
MRDLPAIPPEIGDAEQEIARSRSLQKSGDRQIAVSFCRQPMLIVKDLAHRNVNAIWGPASSSADRPPATAIIRSTGIGMPNEYPRSRIFVDISR